jgi:KTSC domain
MMRDSVSSSNIVSVGYEEASETLEVEFANGTVYQFYNVGRGLYDEFVSSTSKGQFFNANIKNNLPFSRVG